MTDRRRVRGARLVVTAAIAGLAGVAGVALVLGLAPFDAARGVFDAVAPDGRAAGYTEEFHRALAGRLVAVGGVLAAVLVLTGLCRRQAVEYVAALPKDASQSIVRTGRSAASVFGAGPWFYPLGIALVVGIGVYLRLHYLNGPLGHDEAGLYLTLASKPLYQGLAYGAQQLHPLVTVLVHLSTRIFGEAPWAIRLPVFVAGVLTVPLTYWFGSVVFGRAAGLLGAALTAVAWPMVAYSVNGRGYALGGLAFIAMLGLVGELTTRNGRVAWLVFTGLAVVALYSVQSMVFAYASAIVWIVLFAVSERGLQALPAVTKRAASYTAAATLLTLAAYAPYWLVHGVERLVSSDGVLAGTLRMSVFEMLSQLLGQIRHYWTLDIPTAVVAVWAVAAVVAIALDNRARALAGAAIVGSLPLFALVGELTPPARLWHFLFPVFAVIGAAGLSDAARRLAPKRGEVLLAGVGAPAAAAAIGYAAVASNAVVDEMPGRTLEAPHLASLLVPRLVPGDIVIGDRLKPPLRYYLRRRLASEKLRFSQIERRFGFSGVAIRICSPTACPRLAERTVYLVTAYPLETAVEYLTAIDETVPDPERAAHIGGYRNVQVYVVR